MILVKNIPKAVVRIISVIIITILITGYQIERLGAQTHARDKQQELALMQAERKAQEAQLKAQNEKEAAAKQLKQETERKARKAELARKKEERLKEITQAKEQRAAELKARQEEKLKLETERKAKEAQLKAQNEKESAAKQLKQETERKAREKELARKREEKVSLKDELSRAKSLNAQITADFNNRIKDLQDKLLRKDNQITELNSSKDNLARQLQEANAKLTILTSANDSLGKQVEELNISKKSLEGELKQKIPPDLENINTLYNNLKTQLSQLSDLLMHKELELDNNRKEITTLEEGLSSLQSKYQDLETELTLTQQQQKRMVDALNKAATINTSLQQSLVGLSQSITQEEESKEKARDLKSKVEVILTPEEEGR